MKLLIKRIYAAAFALVLLCGIAACAPQPSAQVSLSPITCRVAVDCLTAFEQGHDVARLVSDEGVIVAECDVTLEGGATVFDALMQAAGEMAVSRTGTGSMLYVTGINGMQEGACGAGSGWMYCINGEFIQQSAGAQKLQDGDVLQWRYTCDQGQDLKKP